MKYRRITSYIRGSSFERCLLSALCMLVMGSISTTRSFADDSGNLKVTFSKDVAPIFFERCASCHRPGEVAPMSLLTYADTRPWVKSIRKSVANREMPPWTADPAYGKWSNDISMSDREIETVLKWIELGAPEGNPDDMPDAPEFKGGWQYGTPDVIIDLDEFEIPADGPDLFPRMVVEAEIPRGAWLHAVEILPGNRQVLHHLLVFKPLPGMEISEEMSGLSDPVMIWVAGTPPLVYPEGTGRSLTKRQRFVVEFHYHPNGTAQTDQSKLGLYFGEGKLGKQISTTAHAIDMMVDIPPHGSYEHESTVTVSEAYRITSFTPHLHQRGSSITIDATYPDGKNEILLHVPKFNYDWQWAYIPEEPLRIPEGTQIHVKTVWDNSKNNPHNPNPDAHVTWGEGTDQEMLFALFEMVPETGNFRMPNPIKILETFVAAHPDPENLYWVNIVGMFAGIPVAMHLPPGEQATLYMPGGVDLTIPIAMGKLNWEGSSFKGSHTIIGNPAEISGTILADGRIEGRFDTSPIEGLGVPAHFKDFKGKRVEVPDTVAVLQ